MSPSALLAVLAGYFSLLLFVAWRTSRNADNESFFVGNRQSNWMLVAFGMVGTSLSGVTFISVPGAVGKDGFTYFQIILGHVIGYWIIAFVLLPLYYRQRLTSIYAYLGNRFGPISYKAGALFFILSRTLGATARLYLVVRILQETFLNDMHIPFWLTTLVIIGMILLYTYEGGVKTIVWTDTLQTTCMLLGLAICVWYLLNRLDLSFAESLTQLDSRGLSRVFSMDFNAKQFWLKQIFAGVFIAVAMTGMDQEMMQKNISVSRLVDSQKNVVALSFIMLGVVLLFLYLGGLLTMFADTNALNLQGDRLFPGVVMGFLPAFVQLVFFIALISALFPSADGAITALTSSFCIDILDISRKPGASVQRRIQIRHRVHLSFAMIFLLLVMVFKVVDSSSMIGTILKLASYTYGPLLGLFAFGILTRRKVDDSRVPLVVLCAPIVCLLLDLFQEQIFASYRIGLELLMVNGALTFAGLWFVSSSIDAAKPDKSASAT